MVQTRLGQSTVRLSPQTSLSLTSAGGENKQICFGNIYVNVEDDYKARRWKTTQFLKKEERRNGRNVENLLFIRRSKVQMRSSLRELVKVDGRKIDFKFGKILTSDYHGDNRLISLLSPLSSLPRRPER